MKKILIIAGVLLLVFIIGGLGGVFLNYMLFSKVVANPDLSQNPIVQALDQRVQIIKTTEKVVVADSDSVADIASKASSSVVYIESQNLDGVHTQGNGIVISGDGVIATTVAVVPSNSEKQYVKLANGQIYDAQDVFFDDYNGIVFLRIDANDLSTISFANSDEARSGKRLISIAHSKANNEARFAVGGFLGRDDLFSIASPTTDYLQGVLSVDFSQIAIRQFVGAPAVDFHGNMVGLISYKENIQNKEKEFYAIAANDVYDAFNRFLTKQDQENKKYEGLGVNYYSITSVDAHIQDLEITTGALIEAPQTYAEQQQFANSNAAKSGIDGGDIVVTVNDETVDSKNNLSRLMHKYSSNNSRIVMKVLRNGQPHTIEIDPGM